MSTLKEQGIKAFSWNLLGNMATHGMGFVVSIFLARLLEPSDFGLIAMVMVIIGIANVFTDVGLGSALIQRRKVRPIHYSSVFYLNIFIGLLLTLITYFSASRIGNFYNNDELLPLIQVMSIVFVINAFSSVQNTLLRKELNYTLLTKIGLISSLMSGIIGISLAFWGMGVWSLVAQTLSMGIIYNIIIWTMGQWKPTLEFSWKALTQLWGFGFRIFLSEMINTVFSRLDFLIIGKLFPTSTLGYFQRAKSLSSIVVTYSSGSLMAVLFPVLSKVQNDLQRFQNIIVKSLGIISFVVFLLLGGLYLISEELIVLLFSDKWLPSVEFFKILVLSGFAYPISALLVNVLSSRGNSKVFLKLEIYKKIVVSLNFAVLYFFGIHAYLYGLLITTVINMTMNTLFVSREISLPFTLFAAPIIMQMIITVIAAGSTMLLMQNLEHLDIIMIILKGGLFTFLYILLNYIMQTTSFAYFLDQISPIIKKKLKKN